MFLCCSHSTNLALSWNMVAHMAHLEYPNFHQTRLDCHIFTFWQLTWMTTLFSKHSVKVLKFPQTLKCYRYACAIMDSLMLVESILYMLHNVAYKYWNYLCRSWFYIFKLPNFYCYITMICNIIERYCILCFRMWSTGVLE